MQFIATLQTIVFTCNIAIHTIKFLEITLILQPARSDVKIGPVRAQLHTAYGNRLILIS